MYCYLWEFSVRMLIRLIFLLGLIVFLPGCDRREQRVHAYSLVKLLSVDSDIHDHRIMTSGILYSSPQSGGGISLFLSREDFDKELYQNSVTLIFEKGISDEIVSYHARNCRITGVYQIIDKSPFLVNISSVECEKGIDSSEVNE